MKVRFLVMCSFAAAGTCLSGPVGWPGSSVFSGLGTVRVLGHDPLPGKVAEFGYRKSVGHLAWELAFGLSGADEGFAVDSSTRDTAWVLEPFNFPRPNPPGYHAFFSAYHLAFRIGPDWRLGASAVYATVGLLPHFVSHIYADTAYVPSETEKGRTIFMHEYYLDRYFGLGFDVKAGYRYRWRRWGLGLDAGYAWWVRYHGVMGGIRLERAFAP